MRRWSERHQVDHFCTKNRVDDAYMYTFNGELDCQREIRAQNEIASSSATSNQLLQPPDVHPRKSGHDPAFEWKRVSTQRLISIMSGVGVCRASLTLQTRSKISLPLGSPPRSRPGVSISQTRPTPWRRLPTRTCLQSVFQRICVDRIQTRCVQCRWV